MKRFKSNEGFSLVELMIVIVIIGVLAAVGVPIYTSNVTKAKMAEADATLGSIRTQLRVYYGENGVYPSAPAGGKVFSLSDELGIKGVELQGKNFDSTSYEYSTTDSSANFTLTCLAGTVLETDRVMIQDGTLSGGL